jgi:hypothetical protein
VEIPSGGTTTLKAEKMTTAHTPEGVWEMSRIQEPGLYKHAVFNYRGFLYNQD